MAFKLPPKLQSPFTFAEWLDLDYDKKDPKVAKSLKELNLALINLKRTKPPMASDFQRFTDETSFLIPRFKKMLADKNMPDNVREEVIEPFYDLLRKWQKGATKIQDILEDEDAENAAADAETLKIMQKALAQAQPCAKNYAELAQAIDNDIKLVTQLAALAEKDEDSPKLAAAVHKMDPDKRLQSFKKTRVECDEIRQEMPPVKTIEYSRDQARKFGNKALAETTASLVTQITAIDKLAKAVGPALDKYEEILVPLVEGVTGFKIRR